MRQPAARWNPNRDCWENGDTDLLSGHSVVYSATLPTSGMTHAGLLYKPLMWAHPTTDAASSSPPNPETTTPDSPAQTGALMPSPRASDTTGGIPHGQGGPDLRWTVALLRTPMADEAGGGPLHPDTAKQRGQTLRLMGQILALTGDLLPTPTVDDASNLTRTSGDYQSLT